ncbi:MAG: helix-turn-helix transcriptional regulator [Oscillospiraceae bacterium]|nr:helix-turn-helix transcriptional regulator [Oscillospiraceae bacterium]
MNLGKRIMDIREAKGITRYRVNQITGISGQHIKGIEEGTRQPTIETLEKLVVPLGVSLAELFNEGECMYLSDRERQLIENFRIMSNEKSEALLIMSEALKK